MLKKPLLLAKRPLLKKLLPKLRLKHTNIIASGRIYSVV